MEDVKYLVTDSKAVYSQINHQKKLLRLKRRSLLRLSLSKDVQKKSKEEKELESRCLPESLIREDDIYYNTVKSYVEEAFGVHRCLEQDCQFDPDDLGLIGTHDDPRAGLPCVDSLTTEGLRILAKLLTGGPKESEITRLKLKKVVRESLSAVYGSQNSDIDEHQKKISRRIVRLFSDPENFRDNRTPFMTSQAFLDRFGARKMLAELDEFTCQTILTMLAKLKEIKQSKPQLEPKRNGWTREKLIKRVRKLSEKMLSETGKGDRLPVPLAKAMQVASLSLKLMPSYHNYSVAEFLQFPSGIKELQNEIIKAIWVLKRKEIRITELKIVKSLLDPNANLSTRSTRTAVSNMLTEYLFGCGDIDEIPESLSQALAVINKRSKRYPDAFELKNLIAEEIECVLNVSADARQNVLDLLPENDFEADFTDTYMEDMEESDDEFGYFDCVSSSDDEKRQREEVESTGESLLRNVGLPCPKPDERSNINDTSGAEIICKNEYLAIQGACDETSLIAYSLVGRLLKEFARKEQISLDWRCNLYLQRNYVDDGDEPTDEKPAPSSEKESDGGTVLRVTEELIPSFSESKLEMLRKLLGSRELH